MKARVEESTKVALGAIRRQEIMEMRLFGTNARKVNALCGADTSSDYLRGGKTVRAPAPEHDCWQPAKVAHFESREIRGCFEVWRAP